MPEFLQELQVSPGNPLATSMLAWGYLMLNQPGKALPYAEQSAASSPTLALPQLVLGRSLVDTGDIKGGLEHLRIAEQIDPGNLDTHLALAKALSKSGENAAARAERLLCLKMSEEPTPVVQP
jgi:predicted Zn-dependent protease